MEKLTIKNGNIYLSAKLYESYFSPIEAVVLLKKEEDILMMPIQHASGGLMLKIMNAKGVRVLHASEFFTFNNIDCQQEQTVDAHWNSEMAALALSVGSLNYRLTKSQCL